MAEAGVKNSSEIQRMVSINDVGLSQSSPRMLRLYQLWAAPSMADPTVSPIVVIRFTHELVDVDECQQFLEPFHELLEVVTKAVHESHSL